MTMTTPFLTCKTQPPQNLPNPNCPLPPAFLPTGKSCFTFVAICLRSLVGNRLHLSCGVLHLRLAFGVIILDSLSTIDKKTKQKKVKEWEKYKKRERGDSVSITKSLFSQLNCLLRAAFCVIFQRRKQTRMEENMQDALREFVFAPGTECISHIMGSSSLS